LLCLYFATDLPDVLQRTSRPRSQEFEGRKLQAFPVQADPFPILVLIRTGGPDSVERMQSVRSTWAKDFPKDAIIPFAPDADCEAKYGNNHQQGLTCLEAKHHLKLMNRTDWTWLLVVDDDVYVFADYLRTKLQVMDPLLLEVYGVPYCGMCANGKPGFCGGGGYFINRRSLLMMAPAFEPPVSEFVARGFMHDFMSEPFSDWCDVRFGCVARMRGMPLHDVKGLYGNGFESEKQEQAVIELREQDAPLVFHTVTDDKHMQRIHRIATNFKAKLGPLSG